MLEEPAVGNRVSGNIKGMDRADGKRDSLMAEQGDQRPNQKR